jgi:hypothetical protein
MWELNPLPWGMKPQALTTRPVGIIYYLQDLMCRDFNLNVYMNRTKQSAFFPWEHFFMGYHSGSKGAGQQ